MGVQVQKCITLRAEFTAARSPLYRNGADIGQDVYAVPHTGLQLFLQAQNWVYDPTDMTGAMSGLDKWQNDLAWSAGVGYRFGF